MPVSCSFLLKASARLPALSADSGLPARAHLFTEMRPQEGYHVGVQILGFYLNVYHQLLCIQLPRWLPPCSHHAAWESGPTEPETIWKYTGLEFHLKNWWKLNRKTFLSLYTPDLTLYYIIENASFMLTQLILLKSQSQVYEQGEA